MPVFPPELQAAIEEQAAAFPLKALCEDARQISERYRAMEDRGARLLTRRSEAAAYALSRMPATYAAIEAALREALLCCPEAPRTLLDAGAGTGAGTWAAASLLALERVDLLEREAAMRELGSSLMAKAGETLRGAGWHGCDLVTDAVGPSAELVLCAYVLNELTADRRPAVLRKLWNATERLLLIVEPGTPEGYRQLMEARAQLLAEGAHVAAPCPGDGPCPMPADDWCAFAVRVQRSRLHRLLKGGDAAFEDEKYFYMAFTRDPVSPAAARVLRHPQQQKGAVSLTLCEERGIERRTVTRREGALFRAARRCEAGDAFSDKMTGGIPDDPADDPDR